MDSRVTRYGFLHMLWGAYPCRKWVPEEMGQPITGQLPVQSTTLTQNIVRTMTNLLL